MAATATFIPSYWPQIAGEIANAKRNCDRGNHAQPLLAT
jgi:hypothetical protein